MKRRSLLALPTLAAAAGCGGREDPPANPAASPPPTASSPTASSSATLIAFVMVLPTGTGGATEISGPGQIDRLVGGPPAAIESARAAVARTSAAGTRLFAFVLAGCQNTGAALAVQPDRITATLTGGEGIACFAAEWYLAVFAVPAGLVRPGTRVG